jgi:hypothetical protein
MPLGGQGLGAGEFRLVYEVSSGEPRPRIVLSSNHGGEQERVRAAARIDDRAFAKEMQLIRDFKPPTAFNKIETSLLSNQAGQTDIGRGRTHLVYVREAQICVHLC